MTIGWGRLSDGHGKRAELLSFGTGLAHDFHPFVCVCLATTENANSIDLFSGYSSFSSTVPHAHLTISRHKQALQGWRQLDILCARLEFPLETFEVFFHDSFHCSLVFWRPGQYPGPSRRDLSLAQGCRGFTGHSWYWLDVYQITRWGRLENSLPHLVSLKANSHSLQSTASYSEGCSIYSLLLPIS